MRAEALRPLFLFDGVSDEQLAELAAAGDEVPFHEGLELFHEGEPADCWWMLLEGRVDLVRRAGREEAVVMMTMDRPGVWAGGLRAWNNESSYLATARGASSGRMFRVASPTLHELARKWFPFGVHLIEGFFQTIRSMDSLSRQREALIALGQLAAGFAHEINNPASAVARAVDELDDTTERARASLRRLAENDLTAKQFIEIDTLRREIVHADFDTSPLAVADREEALTEWLDAHGVEDAWSVAPPLATAGLDVEWCERAARALDAKTLEPGLLWISATLTNRALLSEMKDSTSRISSLVDAVKSYSQVDRASLQLIDVTEGIESTLVMLGHKLSSGVTVVRDYSADAPLIEANPGELNQVWTNLLDNAIDAIDGSGTLRISTRADSDDLVVEVADTGSGMTPDVEARAFEPFYTTKDVGKGTGLGLDISRRIVVDRHHGRITIESTATETVLCVRLPRPSMEVPDGHQ